MQQLREHEFYDGVSGQRWCKHCGAVWHAQITATCVAREVSAAPDDRPRVAAIDDAAVISARIAELQAEKDAMLQRPIEPEPEPISAAIDHGDCCG